MAFLSGRKQEDDDSLPGSDLHLDTEVKICPECRSEALPWETTCRTCGVATVRPGELPASELPHLSWASLPELDDGSQDGPQGGPQDGPGDGSQDDGS
jgi:ribosomal protein L40E